MPYPIAAVLLVFAVSDAAAQTSCREALDELAQAIGADPILSAAEQQMRATYASALRNTDKRGEARLQTEQRGWRAGLAECRQSDQLKRCLAQRLAQRTLALQAWYRLVPSHGPVEFACPDGSRISVRYFETKPPSLIAERGDRQSLMLLQPSASGARYGGQDEKLWEHQGRARIAWGKAAPELDCGRV